MTKKPSYRFKGYAEAWEQKKLGEISEKVKEKNTDNLYSSVLTNSAEFGVIPQREFFDKDIANEKNLNGYYVVKPNDFVYNPRISNHAPVGPIKCNRLNEVGVMSPLYYVFRTHGIKNSYLATYFDTTYWHKFMKLYGDSGARADRFAIKDSVFVEMPIPYPTLPEQTAIGSFFQDIDQLISLQQRKLEVLKEQKKTYLKLLFPAKGQTKPALRFAGFEDEWKEVKLGEVTERITRKNKHLESTLPLTISAQYGLVNQETFFNKKVASKDVSGYYLLKRGEFAYNKSYSSDYPWGAVKRLDNYEKGVLSPLYIVFKPKLIDSDFLAVYYDSSNWHKEVSMRATEGARNHGLLNISPQDFFDTELIVPISSAEQEAIGSFFQDLDKAIAKQEEKVNQLKESKQTLLRKMFI